MPIKRYRKDGGITMKKLSNIILGWLDSHEADMAADYKPESEAWKQMLADSVARSIFIELKTPNSIGEVDGGDNI